VEFTGRDATKEFDAAEHSDTAKASMENFLVGEYRE
jgi:cytochrome b involved in lipid metabolism